MTNLTVDGIIIDDVIREGFSVRFVRQKFNEDERRIMIETTFVGNGQLNSLVCVYGVAADSLWEALIESVTPTVRGGVGGGAN